MHKYLKGRDREDRARFFFQHYLETGKEGMGTSEVVESPSLDGLKGSLDVVLGSLLEVILLEGLEEITFRGPSKLNHPVIV